MNVFVAVFAALVFSFTLAHSIPYEPDEETDRFRKGIEKCAAMTGYTSLKNASQRGQELQEFLSEFPGITIINDHFSCNDCEPAEFVKFFGQSSTLKTLQPVLGNGEGRCLFGIQNCKDYAFYTLLMERHPERSWALNYLRKEGVLKFQDLMKWEAVRNPEEAQLVVYEGHHYGVYRGQGMVESKWGSVRAIFRHKLWQVPNIYGDFVWFYKVSPICLGTVIKLNV